MNKTLENKIRFFQEHAGYCTPPGKMICAKQSAEAETWAEESGIVAVWEYDEWPDRSWEKDAKYNGPCEYFVCRIVFPCADCADHVDVEDRCAACRKCTTLDSLSGIVDPSPEYRRVVEAELASEAKYIQEQLARCCAD